MTIHTPPKKPLLDEIEILTVLYRSHAPNGLNVDAEVARPHIFALLAEPTPHYVDILHEAQKEMWQHLRTDRFYPAQENGRRMLAVLADALRAFELLAATYPVAAQEGWN